MMWPKRQSSVGYTVRERLATKMCGTLILVISSYDGCNYAEDLPNGPRVKRINAIAKVLRCGPRFTVVQQDWNYLRLIKTQLGIQPDARFPICSRRFMQLRAIPIRRRISCHLPLATRLLTISIISGMN